MWLFNPEVFFTWFGFWQLMALCYGAIGIMILVAIVLRRRSEAAFKRNMMTYYYGSKKAVHPCTLIKVCEVLDDTICPHSTCPYLPF